MMDSTEIKRSLWEKMVWDHCVNDDDKETWEMKRHRMKLPCGGTR